MRSLPRVTARLTLPGVLLLVFFSSAAAQTREANTAPTSSASISGRVLLDDKPAATITVVLWFSRGDSPFNRPLAKAVTDEDGRFRLDRLKAGEYQVATKAPGFILQSRDEAYGRGVILTVEEGEVIEGLNLTLRRGGVITGRVTDTNGAPVVETYVRISKLNEKGQAGNSYYTDTDQFSTDDRGIYRIYGLPAGRYRVGVGDVPGDMMRTSEVGGYYRRTYYPDATDESQATIVELTEGGVASDIDITVGVKAKTYVASGHVVEADTGKRVPGVRFGYGVVEENREMWTMMELRTNARGEFRLEGMPPGRYQAHVPKDEAPGLYSEPVAFDVKDADVRDLVIKLHRGASVSGTVVIEGASDVTLSQYFPLSIHAYTIGGVNDPIFFRPTIAADGAFRATSLTPGKVLISMHGGGGKVFLKRVEHSGATVTDGFEVKAGEQVTGVRVILVAGTGLIRGQIVAESGALPEGFRASVMVGAAGDSPNRFSVFPQVNERGRFTVENVPEGEYEITVYVIPPPGSNTKPGSQIKQTVSVKGVGETQVTVTLNQSEKSKDDK